jgi:phospholipase C
MACKREPSLQSNQIKNQANMKNRQLLIDLMKRAAAVVTAVAMLATSSGFTFAARPGAERRKSEHAVQRLRHIIVIYQENWSFDSLYGQFPGANGLQHGFDTLPQYDKATNYTSLIYQAPRPLTGFPLVPDPNFPSSPDGHLAWWADHNVSLPLAPFDFTNYISADVKTGDIVHRFYTEQLQIDNGALEPKKNDLAKFVTWSDNPGLVLSYVDATDLPEGRLAQQYTMCDNFFHSAYGGSFLNHQWLIAAQTPPWTTAIPSGWSSSYDPATKVLHDNQLTIDGQYAVNTIQPAKAPFSPGTPNPAMRLLINNTDPSQPGYVVTIGNRMDDAGISWKWYSGGWNVALQNNTQAANDPNIIFQFHHQPFAYFTKYAPFLDAPSANYTTTPALNPDTTGPNAHLQDETQFLADLQHNNLPAVSFIKFAGIDNEHPGYTDVVTGQQHVADIVNAVRHSNIWNTCAIIVTYDEHGGRWDHVPPPVRTDGWGTGVRVPTIIISPLARQGVVDHRQYETVSILKLLESRFNLQPLSTRDADPAVNDLVDAFTE